MAWATTGDVLTYTGQSVTADDVTRAQAIIELYANVTEDADANLTIRDLRLLKQAVSYEAAWMKNQIDVFTRTDVSELEQDDAAITYAHRDAALLAPLAQRCLARLSWMGTQSIRVRGGVPRLTWDQYVHAWFRDEEPNQCWQPL